MKAVRSAPVAALAFATVTLLAGDLRAEDSDRTQRVSFAAGASSATLRGYDQGPSTYQSTLSFRR